MKRIAACLLCLVFCAGLFTACSSAELGGADDTLGESSSDTAAVEIGDDETLRSMTEDSALTDSEVPVPESEPPVSEPEVVKDPYKIALIAMDRMDAQWAALEEGAIKAASELGCEVVNMSPMIRKDEAQAEQIDDAVASGCHAIVIAANDSKVVSSALQEAIAADVKVVCVDVPAKVEAAARVFMDDKAAGKVAGEVMLTALEAQEIEEGAIGIIGIHEDAASAADCEAGFREVFAQKAYELLETQYSEGDAARSHAIAEDYLDEKAVGIFCCNEGSTIGAGHAAEAEDSDVIVVGFGNADPVMDLLDDGYIHGVMIPNYESMGYEAVQAACAVLHGKDLSNTVIDAGTSVLTQE